MIYPTGGGFRMAPEQRLPVYAKGAGIPLYQARREVVFNRFLARMLDVDRDSWALKGGMNLAFRFGPLARPTKDINLSDTCGRHLESEEEVSITIGWPSCGVDPPLYGSG